MHHHGLMCVFMVGLAAVSLGCRTPQSAGSGASSAAAEPAGSSTAETEKAADLLPADDDRWEVSLTPFMWMSSIEGTVGKGGLQAPVDEDFSDIFDDIEGSVALHLAATKGDWIVLGEFAYYDLSASDPLGPLGLVTLDYDEHKVDVELALAYRVLDDYLWGSGDSGRAGRGQLGVQGGGRYTNLDQDFKFKSALGSIKTSESESWVDPVVGLRGTLGLTKALELDLRGDVGGFGVGSDLTWTAQGALAWWVARRATLRVGYRHRSIDYESGGFVYDVDLFGPFFAFTFTF